MVTFQPTIAMKGFIMENKFFKTFNIPPRLEYHTNCFVCDWYDGYYWTHQLYNPFSKYDLKTILNPYGNEKSRFYDGGTKKVDRLKVIEVRKIYPKITPEILLKLEDIALNNDFILTKIPHPNDPLEGDLYKWVDSTNLNRKIYSSADKNRKDAVLSLLINIKEDVLEQIQEIFNAK